MTKQQLIAGDKFEYTGPHKIMAGQVTLRLHDGFLVDPYDQRFCFVMGEPTETLLMAWKEGYGTMTVLFTDCTIKPDQYE